MSQAIKQQIDTLKTDTAELLGKASFVARNMAGFSEAVTVIGNMIALLDDMNAELESLQQQIGGNDGHTE